MNLYIIRQKTGDFMKVDVFISYHSGTSQGLAGKIKTRLESMGYSCWYSGKDMGGGDYASGIMQALTQCRVFLLILNKASSESAHVLNELEIVTNRLAKKEEVTIIPFHVSDHEISPAAQYYISRHHWIDAVNPPMDKHIDELAAQVSALLHSKEDLEEMERVQKRHKLVFWGKLVFCAMAAAALVYGYLQLPEDYEPKKLYYLIHLLLVSAPLVLLMFEPYEKASLVSHDYANYMIVASVIVFLLAYYNIRSWSELAKLEALFDIFEKFTPEIFTKEVIFYGGIYALLMLYPWHRELMKSGKLKLLWTAVSLLTGLWMIVIFAMHGLMVLRSGEGSLIAVGMCLWGAVVGGYILYHNINERKAMRNK